jgi:hypothetical protein
VFADGDNSSAIAREEIAPYRHFDDAISLPPARRGLSAPAQASSWSNMALARSSCSAAGRNVA